MNKKTIDATINGVNVKVIFKSNQWFAKPKNHNPNVYCPNCPHFEDKNGILEVHEDSPDGHLYRVMYPETICSGSLSSGSTYVSNNGKDLVLLPMEESANGFRLNTTTSGIVLNLSDNSYCLMAVGKFSEMMPKPPKGAGTAS